MESGSDVSGAELNQSHSFANRMSCDSGFSSNSQHSRSTFSDENPRPIALVAVDPSLSNYDDDGSELFNASSFWQSNCDSADGSQEYTNDSLSSSNSLQQQASQYYTDAFPSSSSQPTNLGPSTDTNQTTSPHITSKTMPIDQLLEESTQSEQQEHLKRDSIIPNIKLDPDLIDSQVLRSDFDAVASAYVNSAAAAAQTMPSFVQGHPLQYGLSFCTTGPSTETYYAPIQANCIDYSSIAGSSTAQQVWSWDPHMIQSQQLASAPYSYATDNQQPGVDAINRHSDPVGNENLPPGNGVSYCTRLDHSAFDNIQNFRQTDNTNYQNASAEISPSTSLPISYEACNQQKHQCQPTTPIQVTPISLASSSSNRRQYTSRGTPKLKRSRTLNPSRGFGIGTTSMPGVHHSSTASLDDDSGSSQLAYKFYPDPSPSTSGEASNGSSSRPSMSPSSCKAKFLKRQALTTMERWYNQHIENPYPTVDDKIQMAREGGITVSQVSSWFANRRTRSANTRPKKNLIVLRERLHQFSTELERSTDGFINAKETEKHLNQIVQEYLT